MTLEELYNKVNGDYSSTKARFMTDERILRFVRKFPLDPSFQLLEDATVSGNTEEAFRAAHTLKGVAQNLGFTALYETASAVTEMLRGGGVASEEQMNALRTNYRLVVDSIASVSD